MKFFISAKTHKNDSSTRATKLLKLFIENNRLVGFRFNFYFFEKNRILNQNQGESIFHLFLLAHWNLSDSDKEKYHMSLDFNEYSLLKGSFTIETKYKDAKYFKQLTLLMKVVSI